MSFLSRLFGNKGSDSTAVAAPASTADVEYKGFTIRATPRKDQGQYLCAGVIEKTINGVLKQHAFIRADRSPSVEDMTATALMKGQLMVDQQGDSLFS